MRREDPNEHFCRWNSNFNDQLERNQFSNFSQCHARVFLSIFFRVNLAQENVVQLERETFFQSGTKTTYA